MELIISLARRGGRVRERGPLSPPSVGAQHAVPSCFSLPPPLFFGSVDSKGVADAFFVSADSKRIITLVFPALPRGVRKC